jgi:hypothetical protein
LRIWRLPPRCLDDRRLNAQHNEIHIALVCVNKAVSGKTDSHWSSPTNAQIGPWLDKRGALVQYHDDIILPEMIRRGREVSLHLHFSPVVGDPSPAAIERKLRKLYRNWTDLSADEQLRRRTDLLAKRRRSPFASLGEVPSRECVDFWDYVTWDQVLVDIRHLIEKHARDTALVELAKRHDERSRIVRPTGHDPRAIVLVLHRAISHVFGIDPADTERLQLMALKVTSQKLLSVDAKSSKLTPAQIRELRTRRLVA